MTVIVRPRSVKDKNSKRRKCSRCNGFIRIVPLDMLGYKPKEKKKPGRPKKDTKPKRKRYENIGYWCIPCRLFHYLDKDIPPGSYQTKLFPGDLING